MVAPSRIQHLIPSQSAKKKVAAAQHKCTARSDATGSTIFPKRGDPGASHHACSPAHQPGQVSAARVARSPEPKDSRALEGTAATTAATATATRDNQPTSRRAACPDALQVTVQQRGLCSEPDVTIGLLMETSVG